MKPIFLSLFLLGSLPVLSSTPILRIDGKTTTTPASIERGDLIFRRDGCIGCHIADGKPSMKHHVQRDLNNGLTPLEQADLKEFMKGI